MFIEYGGFMHLYKAYMSVNQIELFNDILSVNCFSSILKLLLLFLIGNKDTTGIDGQVAQNLINAEAFIKRLLTHY